MMDAVGLVLLVCEPSGLEVPNLTDECVHQEEHQMHSLPAHRQSHTAKTLSQPSLPSLYLKATSSLPSPLPYRCLLEVKEDSAKVALAKVIPQSQRLRAVVPSDRLEVGRIRVRAVVATASVLGAWDVGADVMANHGAKRLKMHG